MAHANPSLRLARFGKEGGQYLGRWHEDKIDRDMEEIYVHGCILPLSPFAADAASKEEVVYMFPSSFFYYLLALPQDG